MHYWMMSLFFFFFFKIIHVPASVVGAYWQLILLAFENVKSFDYFYGGVYKIFVLQHVYIHLKSKPLKCFCQNDKHAL